MITVKTVPNAAVTVKFLNQVKKLLFQEDKGQYIGFVAASYRATKGIYPLVVEVANGNQKYMVEQKIEIVGRQFVEQRIRVPEQTRKKVLTPANQANDAKVTAAAREKAETKLVAPLWEGPFVWPLSGRITTQFGMIRYVNNIENGRHSGWDIAAPSGTPVVSINKGQVIYAGELKVSGNTVIVHHGLDLYSSYLHLSKINVTEGQMIDKGQVVGAVGMTGLATGPHLHLTIRVGDTPVDPGLFIGKTVAWE
ncbi:MAG TPA: M23 family metallopeptidase [Bacillota bacterium]|nr:M23 family metallopeptidase [Bacillota bacterium]HOL10061.1 M23 family metallopeptidase [Bacillota bacterium]HPO98331.1 M23 family metallopeptidase [Bacillota bacterium]